MSMSMSLDGLSLGDFRGDLLKSDTGWTKKMMEHLNIIQIRHLAFDCSWLIVPYDISIDGVLGQLNGPSLLYYSSFENSHGTQSYFIFLQAHFSTQKAFMLPNLCRSHRKRFACPIFDKYVHCAVLFLINGFCTVCQICYRHCVTCHFWSNILGKWLLAGVSKFVPYLNIAISLWKSDFEGSSSWSECLIKEYRSKKYLLPLCDNLEVV